MRSCSVALSVLGRSMQALGHGEHGFEETMWLADSNCYSDENLTTCDEEHLDADIPDGNVRKRDPRFANQERDKPKKKNKKRRRRILPLTRPQGAIVARMVPSCV